MQQIIMLLVFNIENLTNKSHLAIKIKKLSGKILLKLQYSKLLKLTYSNLHLDRTKFTP
jgi:hypothetical protein